MKKRSSKKVPQEASLERYDWTRARRGWHAGKLRTGTPIRRLDDDLAEAFPTSAAVNSALRAIVALGKALPVAAKARETARKPKGSRAA